MGQAARRCRSSPGRYAANWYKLHQIAGVDVDQFKHGNYLAIWHKISLRKSMKITYIHSCQTFCFFGFRFWEWEELNSEELLGAWWCHVHPSHFASKNVLVTSENISHSKTGFDWVSRCLSCSMQIPVKPAVTLGHGWDVSRPASILDVIEVGWRMDIRLWLDWLSAGFC